MNKGYRKFWAMRNLMVFLGALLLATSAFGQAGSTGAINGTVQDEQGAGIPSAQVRVTNTATGVVERESSTTGAGLFDIPSLQPGTYKVEVTAKGFARFVAEKVRVQVTETTTVNATLKIGQISETVVVTEVVTPVQLSSATTGEVIGPYTVSTLPLSTRNFLTLLTLSAGANTELFNSTALGKGDVTINVNGQRPVNNNISIEGINSNDVNLPIFANVPTPNPETIQEFKTQTSLYDASTGRNGGGNIQSNLRSGTNQYHGNAYEFFRNNVFNANDWFLNRAGKKRPVLRQNQFGASFGGPVPKVKELFFFLNYQGTRANSGISPGTFFTTRIPVLPTTRDAATLATAFLTGTGYTAADIDPTALAFLNLPASKCPGFNDGTHCLPTLAGTPGFTGATLNRAFVSASSLGRYNDDQFVATADKQLTSKDKISGRTFYSNNNIIQPFGIASSLPFAKGLPGSNRFVKVGWTRVWSASIVNEARVGFSRFTFAQAPSEPIKLTDIGATRGNSADFPAAYRINITGAFSLGTGVNDNRGGKFNTYYYADDLTIVRGKHVIRLGMDASRYQLNRFNNFAQRGNVNFANTTAGSFRLGDPALVGFQNFLLGHITSTQASAGFSTFHFRAKDFAGYIQDDYKIKPRLTLNLGLRWEGLSTAHERQNFLSNFRGLGDNEPGPISIIHPAGTANVGTPGVASCTLLTCFSAGNFAPRVSFAWDTFGDQKTVLRGGYGIYYQRVSNQSLLQTSGGLPFSQAISAARFSVTPQNPFPSILPSSAFPLPFDQVVPALTGFNGTTGAPTFAGGGPLSGFFFFPLRNFAPPYAQQWNLGIQRQLYKGWLLEVGYVGTHGVRLLGTGAPVDAGKICTTARPCVIPASIGSNATVPAGTPFVTKNANGSISITANTSDNIDARVPVQYLGLANSRGFFQTQNGNSIYHSLQATLSHQFTGGFYFQAAYTYSKTLDNSSGSSFQDELNGLTGFGDLFNQSRQRGPADFDRTHRFVVSYNYELPFAKMLHVADQGFGKIVNGWSINGVTTFQSGTPFTLYDSAALTLQDTDGENGTNFATLAPGATLQSLIVPGGVEGRLNGYIDLSKLVIGGNCVNNQNVVVAFSDPTCTGFAAVGNIGRNTFRGPFQQNWDMSLIKRTKITERTSIDFRAEAFNLFNHPSFQSPQASASGPGSSTGNYGFADVSTGDTSTAATVVSPRILQLALKFNF